MKVIYHNGQNYQVTDLTEYSHTDVGMTLRHSLAVMSPIIICNEITDVKYLLPGETIKEDEVTYILTNNNEPT